MNCYNIYFSQQQKYQYQRRISWLRGTVMNISRYEQSNQKGWSRILEGLYIYTLQPTLGLYDYIPIQKGCQILKNLTKSKLD